MAVALPAVLSAGLSAAELKPATVAAFERYVSATERRIESEVRGEDGFLHLGVGNAVSQLAAVRRGEMLIEHLESKEGGRRIDIPDGLVHHWVGLVFVPGATVDTALAELQDYDRHAELYEPSVQRSRLISRDGDEFRFYLRFYMHKVIAVTLNTDHVSRFTRPSPTRAYSRVVSTRVQEVEHAGKPDEQELPVGRGGGYLWRINSYWRLLEQDGGVFIECESVSLSRGMPVLLAWLIRPFVTSLPRESLTFTLEKTREALAPASTPPGF